MKARRLGSQFTSGVQWRKFMINLASSLAAVTLASGVANAAASAEGRPTIVLVHGAFVDGSGWAGVYRILRHDGYPVIIVQNPTTSLADDVAATRRAIASAASSVVLVGHSYGGVVITEAGSDPKVSALVYIAAFAPDKNESVATLLAGAPPGAPALPILPPVDGLLSLDREKFPSVFAQDVAPDTARFMADSQVPWGAQALEGKITVPAWKSRPSWYLVPQDDRVIPPAAQNGMAARARATIRTIPGSHAVYVANPQPIASLIEEAARSKAGAGVAGEGK
jgi:pimeloyl-ACP methyl ester carboxylesterase